MAKKNAFLEQFETEEDLEEVRESFISSYALGVADDDDSDPLAFAIESLNDDWELDPEAGPDDVATWLEDENRIALEVAHAKLTIRHQDAVSTFIRKRAAGATFFHAAKAAGEDPAYLAQILLTASSFELGSDRLEILRAARREEQRVKAFQARQKAYRMISKKVEDALRNADFSAVAPDKLVDLMLKLAELSQEDEPPSMLVHVGYSAI